MSVTDVQIINMALAHLGQTQLIAARSELTNEAIVGDLFYDPAVQYCLEDFAWGFARRYVAVGLVEENPNDDWAFSYRYPSDCVTVRRIVTALGRQDPNPPPFNIGQDDTGRLIYTSTENAIIEYTKLVTNTAFFPAMFAEAVSWWLAGLMCPGLAKDREQAAGAFQMYSLILARAQAKDRNESQDPPELESEAIRARA